MYIVRVMLSVKPINPSIRQSSGNLPTSNNAPFSAGNGILFTTDVVKPHTTHAHTCQDAHLWTPPNAAHKGHETHTHTHTLAHVKHFVEVLLSPKTLQALGRRLLCIMQNLYVCMCENLTPVTKHKHTIIPWRACTRKLLKESNPADLVWRCSFRPLPTKHLPRRARSSARRTDFARVILVFIHPFARAAAHGNVWHGVAVRSERVDYCARKSEKFNGFRKSAASSMRCVEGWRSRSSTYGRYCKLIVMFGN